MSPIPRFYLFGEPPPREVDEHFLHLETIADRSAPLQGRIRPHMHGDLNHVLIVTRGHGRVLGEGDGLAFTAPHIVLVPAGSVHGFDFSDDISGHVLTIASAYLDEVFRTRDDLTRQPLAPLTLPVDDHKTLREIQRWVARLGRELRWQAPAHRVAIEANLLGLLAEIERLSHRHGDAPSAAIPPHQRLLARFREQVERNFRGNWVLDDYLKALRATEPQLRYACQKAGESSPMQVLLYRRLIEAKRLLLYSDLTVTDCCHQTGFDDPAYFSRLFRRHVGQSPREFRLNRRT
ncbi:regulatory protein [Asticcacaulis biprosthecium C19]|uniref:Regulatory protein n=1 Tax=Asticcacaulis biprosthecium C19 TaxID=715226 RepID=F4QNZ1_9CAUL|nr:helix-turn-helix domain-containing protein [Asticcacaulis biprosthecium]EGF91049.1 regulatory protein [Asticcacaulis biprosthecium C19]